jgi:hypothetical protein
MEKKSLAGKDLDPCHPFPGYPYVGIEALTCRFSISAKLLLSW